MQIQINGHPYELPADATLDQAVALVSTTGAGVAAALGDEVVPRSQWVLTRLDPGQRVEVLTAAQGG